MKKTGSIFDRKIIIIVLALVLLFLIGLLIFLALTDKNKETSKGVPALEKNKLLENMRLSGAKVFINPSILLERGTERTEYIGIVNTDVTEKTFGAHIGPVRKQYPDGFEGSRTRDGVSFFFSNYVDKRLSPTAGDVIPITIIAKDSAAGDYWYIVNVVACSEITAPVPNCESYASQLFFIKVR